MKRLMILLLLCSMFVIVAPTAPVNAATQTCTGDTFRTTATLFQSSKILRQDRIVNLDGTLEYVVCPNGSNPTIVKPKNITWCFDIQGDAGPPPTLEEYRYNSFIQDNNESVNPLTFTLQAENRNHFCGVQDIAADKERWLERSQNARWNANYTIVYSGDLDEHVDMVGDHTL